MMITRFILAVLHRLNYEKLPDSYFLRVKYLLMTGRFLHLRCPKKFTEKIQWLKLYNRKPEYTMMVDKIAVKEYVAGKIGAQYVVPTIGMWKNAEDIDFETLPPKFVLKANNGGGGNAVIVCRDKSVLDRCAVVGKLNHALQADIYKAYREWPYKDVPPTIFAERLLEMPGNSDLPDYKFFCFNGKPKYCQVISNRAEKMSIDFFDRDWHHQAFREPKEYPFADVCPQRPRHYEEMWRLATVLAAGIPFVRIDFYDTGDAVYFGEITFFPTSGMQIFEPRCWDKIFGTFINLPDVEK